METLPNLYNFLIYPFKKIFFIKQECSLKRYGPFIQFKCQSTPFPIILPYATYGNSCCHPTNHKLVSHVFLHFSRPSLLLSDLLA